MVVCQTLLLKNKELTKREKKELKGQDKKSRNLTQFNSFSSRRNFRFYRTKRTNLDTFRR